MSQTSNGTVEGSRRTVELTERERHQLLAAERRRAALDVLAGRTTPAALTDVARALAEQEAADDPDEAAVERVAVTLHHVHLPRLDAAGVADYDPETRRIDPDGSLVDSLRG